MTILIGLFCWVILASIFVAIARLLFARVKSLVLAMISAFFLTALFFLRDIDSYIESGRRFAEGFGNESGLVIYTAVFLLLLAVYMFNFLIIRLLICFKLKHGGQPAPPEK